METKATTDLLVMSETAALLRKTTKQLEWMIYSGTAPQSAKIGGRRMFRRADVQAYIDAAFDAEPSGGDRSAA